MAVKKTVPLENSIERKFRDAVKARGCWVRKLITPGYKHACDRIVIWPATTNLRALIELVEIKRPGEEPRPGQKREHMRLRQSGVKVYVISTEEELAAYMKAHPRGFG